jgi:hypothetical protein
VGQHCTSGVEEAEEESDEVHCCNPACSVWWYKDATLEDARVCVVCNQVSYCSQACQVSSTFPQCSLIVP